MRPSKGEMLQSIKRLERIAENRGHRLDRLESYIDRQDELIEQLAEMNGYRVEYKKGHYLVPIKEEPYGN